jgi:hypothetical protein
MTGSDQDRGAQLVDQLLAEAGLDDANDLRPLLLELRSLGAGAPPVPSAELAALMTAGPVDLSARRRMRHRRLIVAAIAVAASVGVGASAAAASPEFRHTAQQAITFVLHSLAPGMIHAPGSPRIPAPAGTRAPATPGVPSGGAKHTSSVPPSATPSPTRSGDPRPAPPTTGVPASSPPPGIQKESTTGSTHSGR